MRAISIQQPWAYFLFHGKPLENRDWPTSYRGPLLIHAGKTFDYEGADWIWENREKLGIGMFTMLTVDQFPLRAFVGQVNFKTICTQHDSPWFFGKYGFVFEDQEEFEKPIPWLKGRLGIFHVPDEVLLGR